MCGINGFIKFENGQSTYADSYMKSVVHDMNEKIIHRGPNSEGLYVDESCSLGMRRLAIIDLDTGAQPIYNQTHDKLIVFNGEIYNYKELRAELIAEGCVFQTKSDTEVVLVGVERYGKDFIKRLEGMFAFCIYDKNAQTWLLARDKAGEKPFYYYKGTDFMLFASELKSLLCTNLVPREIDEKSLTTYFQLAYVPAPKSIIKGVYKLMPGTIMQINKSGYVASEVYWSLKEELSTFDEKYNNYDNCKKWLRDALFESVEHRMISDVPLGAFLSGGIDSSIIVGIMSELSSHPINTFTIGFQEKTYDESELAAITAKKNGAKHHILRLDWDAAVGSIDTILDNMDEPFADPSLVASYVVSKMTKEYVTVALTGDGSDELFGGYNKYLMPYYGRMYKKVPPILRKRVIEPTMTKISSANPLFRKVNKVVANAEVPVELQTKRLMSRAFSYEEAGKLLLKTDISKMNFIKKCFYDLDMPYVDEQLRIQYVDFHTVLEGQMLPKVDRAGMLASLETRVPMLDSKVISLAFHMPGKFKIAGKHRKIILKDTFKDMLPAELFKAQKHGFDVPVGVWLRGELKSRLDKYSSKEFIEKQGLFNKEFVDAIIKEHKSLDVEGSTKLWSFFVFQSWYERYMKEE
ncbi:MAG: asparagine synthase (glutamine-hydrolyzing) [Bacteroidales bacterium]|nr:asparagine synthase (glutamine-hydrolyzing) [Lachnoclostridium sp.]MCM1384723.1 asparagine synthase (glutamine-hydrolyzing) [Lachnoclostridium sp.]MCM1465263.1 asparagine synthase (glutamine-hydrolyzing) [Bacteroidales bacterium]